MGQVYLDPSVEAEAEQKENGSGDTGELDTRPQSDSKSHVSQRLSQSQGEMPRNLPGGKKQSSIQSEGMSLWIIVSNFHVIPSPYNQLC